MEETTWNARRIEGAVLTIWIKEHVVKSFKDSEDAEVLEFNRKVRDWEDGAEWCEEIPEFRFPDHARKNRSVGDRVDKHTVRTIIGECGCAPFQKVHQPYEPNEDRNEREVGYLLDTSEEWDNQTVETFDWNADVWFASRFRKTVTKTYEDEVLNILVSEVTEVIGDVDFDTTEGFKQDYELGHTRSVFASMRVWNSNGRLNVGSMVIEPEKQRAVCRYCGAKITYAQCLAHVNNSEWDAKELFTAMTWAHGYNEMSRNPKVTNFAQGEVSIDTKAIWENYRMETTKSKEEVK